MSTVAAPPPVVLAENDRRALRFFRALRLALVCGLVLLGAATVALGERQTSLDELYSAAGSAGVTTVKAVGGLPAGATGTAALDLHWSSGHVRRVTSLTEASAKGTVYSSSDSYVTSDDVVGVLRTMNPSLRIVQDRHGWTSGSTSVFGWSAPQWFSPLLGLEMFLMLFLVTAGPRPWRATRWAWFWLICTPIGAVAFLLLSGPSPYVARPTSSRVLGGGWAFLLSCALGAALPLSRHVG